MGTTRNSKQQARRRRMATAAVIGGFALVGSVGTAVAELADSFGTSAGVSTQPSSPVVIGDGSAFCETRGAELCKLAVPGPGTITTAGASIPPQHVEQYTPPDSHGNSYGFEADSPEMPLPTVTVKLPEKTPSYYDETCPDGHGCQPSDPIEVLPGDPGHSVSVSVEVAIDPTVGSTTSEPTSVPVGPLTVNVGPTTLPVGEADLGQSGSVTINSSDDASLSVGLEDPAASTLSTPAL